MGAGGWGVGGGLVSGLTGNPPPVEEGYQRTWGTKKDATWVLLVLLV